MRVGWEKKPELSCIICTFPRAGSSLLSYGLQDTGLVGHPSEYFGPTVEAKYADKWGLPARYSLRDYLRSMATQTMTENGVMAVKLFMPYLSNLLRRARAEFGQELSESELLGRCFPNPKYIFLRRDDLIRQAISFIRAINNLQFESRTPCPGGETEPEVGASLDLDKITAYVETFRKQEREWREFFERNCITAHEVVYEDLAVDFEPTIFGALGSLGVPPPPGLELPRPRLERQSDEMTERMAARYAEYQALADAGRRPGNTPAGTLQAIDRQLRNGVSWLAGVTASYLFDLAGDGGGIFHLIVREGVGWAGPGSVEDPDVTFTMTAETFTKMKGGTIDDGAIAFLNGEVTMDGDQALALALAPLWFDGVDMTGYDDS